MKFNKERTDKIIELIRAGNYKETAAASSGISEQTLYNWIKRGQEATEGDYFEFFEAIKRAEGEAEARNVMIIQKAAVDTWQAAAWWLERTKYHRWGRKDNINLSGELTAKVTLESKLIKDE